MRDARLAGEAAPVVFHSRLKRRVHQIKCPEDINLSTGLASTLEFFVALRASIKAFKKRLTIDLRTIQRITPAGALALAAELDTWRKRYGLKKLNAIDADEWNPLVRARLREMGFFDLLHAKCTLEDIPNAEGDRFLPFISGVGSEGGAAKSLRTSIESLGLEVRDREALYDGLVEAMTNVRHHAYEADAPLKYWWMSASVDITSSRLTVMFLDHGVGIPRTLPKSKIWERVRGFLDDRGLPLSSDAKLIEAAVSVERTRTNEEHRGNGLRNDIQGYVETHPARGKLRILSGSGQYVYRKDVQGEERTETSTLVSPIQGTFIEWVIEDYGASDDKAH